MTLQFFPRSTVTPDKPRKPPATSTTTGGTNVLSDTPQSGEYGAKHRTLKMYPNGTRQSDFKS